jgi:porphobilinogen synthase
MKRPTPLASGFPDIRLRRNRRDDWSRALVSETSVQPSDLILPMFVQEGTKKKTPVASMPGVHRLSIDLLVQEAKQAEKAGIPAIAIFPVVDKSKKTDKAEEAFNANNLICRAVKAIKKETSNLGIICDVALDPYTSHGQDGLVVKNYVDNDLTVEALCKQSVVQAKAGCDIIAPSDMMDGRVGAIRHALDDAGFEHVRILSYSAKYASAFYGPFRDAVGSSAQLGKASKKTYQMDPANVREALREVEADILEGADMVMVKPGLPYLDIIRAVHETFDIPVLAYQVSGEYAMLKAAAQNGWLDFDATMRESLLALKRAGACGILTYGAMGMV